MRARRILGTVGAAGLLALVPGGVAHAAPSSGGCQDFGRSVSFLARTLGAGFGANASFAATRFPGAFPELVVVPEQDAACPD
jgi:hypothetical protein